MDFFSRLCGFDDSALGRISDPRDRNQLGISSLLSLMGVVLSGLSAAYLFLECTDSWPLGLGGGALVLLALYALLVILISSTTLPIFKSENRRQDESKDEPEDIKVGPRWTRLIIFLLISLAFTQPIAVFLLEKIPDVKKQIERKTKVASATSYRASVDKMDNLLAERERDMARLSETYDRLLAIQYANTDGGVPRLQDTSPSNRKALVIGNGNYAERPLQNPAKDAKDIAAALEKIGFKVKIVLDADRLKMEREIDSYAASLA
ncbi:MAG: caspase family protein [Betaproteobacteria bacterium]|nr:caspase family protein [Betaproteobacteria bacterium]